MEHDHQGICSSAYNSLQGMAFDENGPVLISSIIENLLGIDVSVLCGANIAKDVAWGHFSETTIGTELLWARGHANSQLIQFIKDTRTAKWHRSGSYFSIDLRSV